MRKVAMIVALLFVAQVASGQCLLTFQTESLPTFFVGQPVNFQIEAVSGTEPYKFEIFDGAFPEDLHLTPSGRIVGVPRVEADTTVFVTVTDAEGCRLTQAFAVRVEQP